MVGSRYGLLPTQVWETLPPRLISRYYLLIQREVYRQQMFQLLLHGGGEDNGPDPSWLEDPPDDATPPPPPPTPKKPCPPGFVRAMVPADEGGLTEIFLERGSPEFNRFFGA